ncbi:MAG: DUF2892 domain-containing protein [Chloroflexi bacterium]|nr:DUF2892 domain-containing protein [Chloroflexota bacterium]MCL5109142.1 DUF2892 domain-containing protein [Chloroflexota bacterium]
MASTIRFLNSWVGRAARVVLGLALIYWGWFLNGSSTLGIVVAVVGLVPIAMALWGRCLLQFLPGGRKAGEA